MSFRSAFVAFVALGLASAAPAFAANPNAEAAVAAMPHSDPVSNGIPVELGDKGGQPRIRYLGDGSGNLSAGVPHVVGSDAGGEPIITYGN